MSHKYFYGTSSSEQNVDNKDREVPLEHESIDLDIVLTESDEEAGGSCFLCGSKGHTRSSCSYGHAQLKTGREAEMRARAKKLAQPRSAKSQVIKSTQKVGSVEKHKMNTGMLPRNPKTREGPVADRNVFICTTGVEQPASVRKQLSAHEIRMQQPRTPLEEDLWPTKQPVDETPKDPQGSSSVYQSPGPAILAKLAAPTTPPIQCVQLLSPKVEPIDDEVRPIGGGFIAEATLQLCKEINAPGFSWDNQVPQGAGSSVGTIEQFTAVANRKKLEDNIQRIAAVLKFTQPGVSGLKSKMSIDYGSEEAMSAFLARSGLCWGAKDGKSLLPTTATVMDQFNNVKRRVGTSVQIVMDSTGELFYHKDGSPEHTLAIIAAGVSTKKNRGGNYPSLYVKSRPCDVEFKHECYENGLLETPTEFTRGGSVTTIVHCGARPDKLASCVEERKKEGHYPEFSIVVTNLNGLIKHGKNFQQEPPEY